MHLLLVLRSTRSGHRALESGDSFYRMRGNSDAQQGAVLLIDDPL